MMMLFVCLLVLIILGVHISSTYAISSFFLPFSKSTSNLHHSQDQEQEVTSGNTLSLQYMRHKSDPSKHPLPIPTTEFEVICLKILAEEAARESQNELTEKYRQSQLELAEKNRQSQLELAEKTWQSQEKVSESTNRGYIFLVILGGSFYAFGACVLGFSIVNFGAGTERAMDNIAKSLDELVLSSNDFLSIIRSYTWRSFFFGWSKKQSTN